MSVWRLVVRDQRSRDHDVFVEAETVTPMTEVAQELDRLGFRVRPFFVGRRRIDEQRTIGDVGLHHGDVLVVGRPDDGVDQPGAGTYVVVVAGPDAGSLISLPDRGVVQIGRSTSCDLALADDLLSLRHCTLRNESGRVTLVDDDSTNGTFLEGVAVSDPVGVDAGAYVQVGSSVITIEVVAPSDLAVLEGDGGPEISFPRQYRHAEAPLPGAVKVPKEPSTPGAGAGSGWWRALLPLVTGFGFAAITGRWIFLLIMVISPIVVAIEAFRKKRRRTRDAADAVTEYEQQMVEYGATVARLRDQERSRRRRNAPCGGAAIVMADVRHRRLWERSADDPDFLSVAVGLAPLPSTIDAPDPAGHLESVLWGTPIETSLARTGSLSIVGPIAHGRATARAIVTTLATTHSPVDMKLWVLTDDETGERWGSTRWLPHTASGEHTSSIAATPHARSATVERLRQIIDTRLEGGASGGDPIVLPAQVVVIDGTDLVERGDLTDLLRRGPQAGVVAVIVDPRLSPEGAGATLTLGEAADLATFDSRHQPRCDNIIVPEITPAVADLAARRLAPLRSVGEGHADGGVCHLVDIDGLHELTATTLVERWSAMSPNLVATVGLSGELPMLVDLVRDGPHGLIGGTSGSGKTEFLKTLFISLCVNNHPDDLSIVVVDFKGGVDHDAIRPLPHVVDVATNLDIAQFNRTIRLLDAEQRRRQALLGAAGANNLDSYRQARAERPELPPLPRLLVVVDEFGELLASEGGRDKMRELESITRIGRALGLHLLLVTQNFEGNLPGQIDANAGLRVSLRVQKPAHSKAVLDSGVAASIPDRLIGRAYARFHGRDLIEFQTARVAGRRRDLDAAMSNVDARIVAFGGLIDAPPSTGGGDVPNEHTDMFRLVEACRSAAALSGWTRNAVPWPASLPERVSGQSLLASRGSGARGVPIGLVDLPEHQRRSVFELDDGTEQWAVLGAASAPIPEVLATMAAAMAMVESADDLHLYVIDLVGSGLAAVAGLPHCGGVAIRDEQLSLRMLRWLLAETARRRALLSTAGASTVREYVARGETAPPRLVLFVSGADRLVGADDGPGVLLRGPLTSLMSDARGVGIQIVLGGAPKIVHNRLGAGVQRRMVFEMADPADYAGVGADRGAVGDLHHERRAVLVPEQRVVQIAQLAPPGHGEGPAIAQLGASLTAAARRRPHRFVDIPWPLPLATLEPVTPADAPHRFLAPLPVALDTMTGEWAWIDAVDDGPLLAVVGPPKSGRSTMLAVIADLARGQGWWVVNATTSRRSPLIDSDHPALVVRCGPDELAGTIARLDGRGLVVIDDLQRIESSVGVQAVLAAQDRVLLAVAAPPDYITSRNDITKILPSVTTGVLLAPVGSLDGSAIGLRRLPAEWTSNPRPGRGIMAVAGEATEIQVPLIDVVPCAAAARNGMGG